jgi:hypothetical protein
MYYVKKQRLLSCFIVMFIVICLMEITLYAQGQASVDVVLPIRSGIPNAGWRFEETADLDKLQMFISGLPEAEPIEGPRFGGFILSSEDSSLQFPVEVIVFNGVVQITSSDKSISFFRDEKGLESCIVLYAVSRGVIDIDIFNTITKKQKKKTNP